jgi:V8-like Glu-specific endopeptidase
MHNPWLIYSFVFFIANCKRSFHVRHNPHLTVIIFIVAFPRIEILTESAKTFIRRIIMRRYHIVLMSVGVLFANLSFANDSLDAEVHHDPGFWTEQRMRDARPIPFPTADFTRAQPILDPELQRAISESKGVESQDAAPPTVKIKPDYKRRLFVPKPESQIEPGSALVPFEAGTSNFPFTSSLVFPMYGGEAWQYSADFRGPYRKVGLLQFSVPGSTATCTAAVIHYNVILTAGHCVHSGNGNVSGYYANFQFIPAFRDGFAPYRVWEAEWINTTPEWFFGGGKAPNPADFAVIVLKEQSGSRVGDVVGKFGWQTNSLAGNHVTMLGYPASLDGGNRMHRVDSQSMQMLGPTNVIFGTDMTQGSSGGPWIQNFGKLSVGQTGGTNPGRNRIVGVTSSGPEASFMAAQSSVLSDSFIALYQWACDKNPRNCNL